MFNDEYLITHLDKQQSIEVETACFIELNQNVPPNVQTLGVLKSGVYSDDDLKQWDTTPLDAYYKHDYMTTAMKRDVWENETVFFGHRKKAEYFNLADCFTEFRPRSGIVKTVVPHGEGQVFVDNFRSVYRPRYYIPSVKDEFKYWTSWNSDISTPTNQIGLSDKNGAIQNASPFIVYKTPVPSNKVTVKFQTGLGNGRIMPGAAKDPLINIEQSTIPKTWSIQYLDIAGTWQNIYVFNAFQPYKVPHNSGTIDIAYVVKNPIPTASLEFVFKGYFPTVAHLPLITRDGDGYSVGAEKSDLGTLYIYHDQKWNPYGPLEREWVVIDPTQNPENYAVREYMNPRYFNPTHDTPKPDGYSKYAEFVVMRGLRIMVYEMYSAFRSFDLIELSPRLFVNLSKNVVSYSIDKAVSEDNVLPVGEMSVSNGSVSLSNTNLILNKEQSFDYITGEGSVLAERIDRNSKLTFFEIIRNVDRGGIKYDYFVPIKTLYVTEKPFAISGTSEISMGLRDLTFRFEELYCPNIVLKQCSTSKAVATILDWIGFTNYIFDFTDDDPGRAQSSFETIIPYFYVNEEMTIAEALQSLAIATQSAMFFDEYNNFVVMPRQHFGRKPVYTLRGQTIDGARTNIEELSDIVEDMIGDIEIKYIHRELARAEILNYDPANRNAVFEYGEKGALLGYKVSELWNASDLDVPVLAAVVLNTTLTDQLPVYDATSPDRYRNHYFDVGVWTRWMPFKGMVMMNGEIIRYDAIEYSIEGKLHWITSQVHLNDMRSTVSFNQTPTNDQIGVPTGRVRIWMDIELTDAGRLDIVRHGRGMYNTPIVVHSAEPIEWMQGISSYQHVDTSLKTVFSNIDNSNYDYVQVAVPAERNDNTKTTNYIYNPLHSQFSSVHANPIEILGAHSTDIQNAGSAASQTSEKRIMRSSSLTFGGPPGASPDTVYRKIRVLDGDKYSTFGARLGIVGVQSFENGARVQPQTPLGAAPLAEYTTDAGKDNEEKHIVYGAGGGICIYTSRLSGSVQSNDGYYFEITALDGTYQSSDTAATENLATHIFPNINFYKINYGTPKPDTGLTGGNVAVKLFSAYKDIRVTTGSQAKRDRLTPGSTNVYDIAVDVKEVGLQSGILRTFTLYINDIVVGVVTDFSNTNGYFPLRDSGNTEFGIFVRGGGTVQFEHIYAVGGDIDRPKSGINTNIYKRPSEFKLYSPSAIWASRALLGGPDNSYRYYEEFGSIARECRRIDAKFQMYPVFLSTINRIPIFDRAYSITHYQADPYNASFMIWCQGDSMVPLTDNTAVSIIGLTLADNQQRIFRLDDYLVGNYSTATPEQILRQGIQDRNDLLAKRTTGQTSNIDLESIYIQSEDYARRMLSWLNGFVGFNRIRINVAAFAVPHLQIGDIVTIDYDVPYLDEKHVDPADPELWNPTKEEYPTKKFKFRGSGKNYLLRKISIDRDISGPDYTLSLVELPDDTGVWRAGDW